jgi:acetyl-CoA carboxylase biotin carboxyl carrier protein
MNLQELKELLELFEARNISELELERNGFRVKLKKTVTEGSPLVSPMTSQESPVKSDGIPETPSDETNFLQITSPIVGTLYRAPAPDADFFVEVNDIVEKGQVLCIVEAMKVMNEIESDLRGRIVAILVENSQPVEYGQPLFLVEPM